MSMLTPKHSMTLLISVALIFAIGISSSTAQQKIKVAGKFTSTQTRMDSSAIGDAEGHVFSLTEYKGTNVSTGEHKFMDGAQVFNVSFTDLVKGNGPQQGYIEFSQQDDRTYAKWEGNVTTTLSAEDTPIITFEGTFSWIKGTGQFENIQGKGTYSGQFTSKTTYSTEWTGEYIIKK
jgi:hypothetical protein